jgi:branched-chain amino acid transport system permease protein
MSFQATLKGVVAQVIGGVGNVPGAIVGSLLLGLIESYGIALFGTTYRNLFAFVLLISSWSAAQRAVRRPRAPGAARAADRHLHRAEPAGARAALGRLGAAVAAFALPLATGAPYLLQTLTNAWLAAMLALSLT